MRKLFLLSIFSLLTTGAVFAADRDGMPDPSPVASGTTEVPSVKPTGKGAEVTAAATCYLEWDCRRCGSPSKNQNVLYQICDDGTQTVVEARACGEACF